MHCNCPYDLRREIGKVGSIDHSHGGGAWTEHGDADAKVKGDRVRGEEGVRNALGMKILHTLKKESEKHHLYNLQ